MMIGPEDHFKPGQTWQKDVVDIQQSLKFESHLSWENNPGSMQWISSFESPFARYHVCQPRHKNLRLGQTLSKPEPPSIKNSGVGSEVETSASGDSDPHVFLHRFHEAKVDQQSGTRCAVWAGGCAWAPMQEY